MKAPPGFAHARERSWSIRIEKTHTPPQRQIFLPLPPHPLSMSRDHDQMTHIHILVLSSHSHSWCWQKQCFSLEARLTPTQAADTRARVDSAGSHSSTDPQFAQQWCRATTSRRKVQTLPPLRQRRQQTRAHALIPRPAHVPVGASAKAQIVQVSHPHQF